MKCRCGCGNVPVGTMGFALGHASRRTEHRLMMSSVGKSNTGKVLSPKHRAKVVAATQGVWLGRKHKKSTIRKISKSWIGRKKKWPEGNGHTPQAIKSLREAQIKRLISDKGYSSQLEFRARQLLRKLKICVKRQYRLGNHPYDFVCHKRKVMIEVNGCYYHDHRCTYRPKGRKGVARMRDGKWAWLAKKNGYTVLVLWECEEKNWSKLLLAIK